MTNNIIFFITIGIFAIWVIGLLVRNSILKSKLKDYEYLKNVTKKIIKYFDMEQREKIIKYLADLKKRKERQVEETGCCTEKEEFIRWALAYQVMINFIKAL